MSKQQLYQEFTEVYQKWLQGDKTQRARPLYLSGLSYTDTLSTLTSLHSGTDIQVMEIPAMRAFTPKQAYLRLHKICMGMVSSPAEKIIFVVDNTTFPSQSEQNFEGTYGFCLSAMFQCIPSELNKKVMFISVQGQSEPYSIC
jgi:hypothetical protein